MTGDVISDPRLARAMAEKRAEAEKAQADVAAAGERQRSAALRMQAMHYAIQAWPHALERGGGSLRALAEEIHAFLCSPIVGTTNNGAPQQLDEQAQEHLS